MNSTPASIETPLPPPEVNQQAQSDWPVNVAAQALRKAFLQHLLGPKYDDETEPLSEAAFGVLRSFYRALIHPAGRTRLGLWIELFGGPLWDDWSNVLNWQQTGEFDQRQSELHGEDRARALPDFPERDGKTDVDEIRRLLKLFEQLLGMAVMRPVIGDKPLESSVYYAAFHHPLFTSNLEETKQLILESVVVPAGRGSVGRCYASSEGTIRSGISFGDFQGVVEWQDLVQGQVAMLMARKQASDDEGKPYAHLVITAYSPVAFIFDDEIPHGPLTGINEMTRVHDNPFTRALRDCLKDDALIEMSGALSEFQESRRRESQFRRAIESASEKEVNAFASAIVDLLIPTHFTDLPVPLDAAYALVADARPQRKDEFSIAHLRVTSEALERIIARAAGSELKSLLAKCDDDDPLGRLTPLFSTASPSIAQQSSESPKILSFQLNPKAGLLLLPAGGENCEAIWWLHSRRSRDWPAEVKELAAQIHGPLTDIVRIAEKLVGWHDDSQRVEESWRSTLPLFAEYKLRDNLATQYYGLATRVLFADDEAQADRRLKEFSFLLRICAQFGGFTDTKLDEGKIVNAGEKLKELWRFMSSEAKVEENALLGATAFVRLRHRVLGEFDELPPDFRPLLPLLRIQQRYFPGMTSVQLEDPRDGRCRGIDLESLGGGRFKGMFSGKAFTGSACDSFSDPVTDINPRCALHLTNWIMKEVGTGVTHRQIEAGLKGYLGLSFSDLRVSKYPKSGDLQAVLRVAFQDSTDQSGVLDSYESKLEAIANWYRVTLGQHYQASATISQATLAAYARGASHGLKNAITGSGFLFGGKPQRLLKHLPAMPLSAKNEFIVRDCTESSIAVEQDLEHLKRESELFFWIMDPARAKEELEKATDFSSLEQLIASCLLQAFHLALGNRLDAEAIRHALNPPDLTGHSLRKAKERLVGEIAVCRQMYLMYEKTADWRDGLERLLTVLKQSLQFALIWPSDFPNCSLDARTMKILEAVLVESLQNAVKASLRTSAPLMQVSVQINSPPRSELVVEVMNSALPKDVQVVRDTLGPKRDRRRYEYQVHGVRGLWQLELLCDRLGEGRISLGEPRFGASEVLIQFVLRPSSQ